MMTKLESIKNGLLRAVSGTFSLDLRSLAVMRIMLGFMLIWDLVVRSKDLRTFYADDGALPRYAVLDFWHRPTYISVHMMSGSWVWEGLLFLLAGFCAFCFMVGCRTRLMGFLSWFLLISLHVRNPLVLNGGDIVLRLILFWCLFLPLGARYSIDAAPPRKALGEWAQKFQSKFLSVASFGFILQIAIIYFVGGLLKTGSTWRDGTALYYAMNVDYITWRVPADWLLSHPNFMLWMGKATFILELWGTLLLLVPLLGGLSFLRSIQGPARWTVCMIFIGLHIGFATFMTLGLFPFICIAAWIGLFPGWFWDRVGLRESPTHQSPLRYRSRWWTQILALLAVYAVATWNLGSLPKHNPCPKDFVEVNGYCMGRESEKLSRTVTLIETCPKGYEVLNNVCKRTDSSALHAIEPVSDRCPNTYQREGDYCIAQSEKLKQATHVREIHWMDVLYGRPVDKWLTPFARMFRLDQKWNMFAPNPLKDDGWFVIPGQQVNGTELELFQGGEVDWEKPEQVSDMYVDQRWRKYMRNIYKKSYKDFRIYYGKHLCRAFNEGKTGDQRLQTFQLHFVRERTPPPTTTTSFTIPIDQLSFESNPDGALDFEACAEICIRDTRIDTNVSACSKKEGTGEKLAMEEILARFSCTGVEVAEPEPVKLWSHRCFKTQE